MALFPSLPINLLELPGALADASWNGVPFYMPDSRHTAGRRVQQFFFPGRDTSEFQDLGAFDGPMQVSGLIVGGLYVSYARQLLAALQTPGPGTLVHPWLGELQMVLTSPAQIAFSQKEQRVVRFTATFAPFVPLAAQGESWLDTLLDDIAGAVTAVRGFLGQLLAPVGQLLWLAGQVDSFASSLAGYWQAVTGAVPGGITGAAGNPVLAASVAQPVSGLLSIGEIATGSGYASAVAARIGAVPAAIAAATTTAAEPAVGPGDAAASAAVLDGQAALALLLAASADAAASANAAGLTGGLALAHAAYAALYAAQVATGIAWASAQAAQAALAQLLAALDAAAAAAAVAAIPGVGTTTAAVAAGQLWTALQDARAALVADMTATIGRLPQVRRLALAAPLPAWVVANMLAGDTPALILPAYTDLVARNAVRHPAALPAGIIESLTPAEQAALVPGAVAQ